MAALAWRIGESILLFKMPSLASSLQSLARAALAYSQSSLIFSGNVARADFHIVCPPVDQLSCHTPDVQDTCCVNSPGGLFLQTQFWDTNPVTGPSDSWTIHGLWPDNCDGTYASYCDPTREYINISAIIRASGKTDVLDYMNTYWKDYQGDDESLWAHEWNKHGTCISSFEPKCYSNHDLQQGVVDYFVKTTEVFSELRSFIYLSAVGIVPSETRTYTAVEIQSALRALRGADAIIKCKNDELNEIWYFFNIAGSAIDGSYIATNPAGANSTCPETGIKYLPKTGPRATPRPSQTSSTGTTPTGGPGGRSFSGRGTLSVTSGGKQNGCIISKGTWYTTGTCATFTATTSGSGFTLTSSKGKCAVQYNILTCSDSITTPTVFSNHANHLAYHNSSTWYTNSVPTGSIQAPVSVAKLSTSLTISWKGA